VILRYLNGRFVADCSFREREIPKAAGMRWDPSAKHWWTVDHRVAEKLLDCCDPSARAMIDQQQQGCQTGLDASRAMDAEMEVPVPAGKELRGYQKAGVAYALAHQTTLLADEMGVGKTIQALALVNADPSIRSVLVVCPASVKLNWRREARAWLTRPMSMGIAGESFPQTEMVIMNYDILRKYRVPLRARHWDLAIFDESHMVKNPGAQRTAEVFGQRANKKKQREGIEPIPARRRLFLTGTPILNKPIELWPILKSQGWNWLEFVTKYCAGHQNEVKIRGRTKLVWDVSGDSNLEELQQRLRAELMVRRLKRDVLSELPPKVRQIIEVSANGAADQVQAELALLRSVAPGVSEDDYLEAVSRLQRRDFAAFSELSRLRHETALAKVPAVTEHVAEAVESSGKIILFGHHKDALHQIGAGLTKASIKSVLLTGDMTRMEDRQRSVDQFQSDPQVQVFIGTIGAAGVGIGLTASSHVVFGELDWVPGNMSQAEDRSHRYGQRKSVLVQHIVFEGSLDALVAQTLVRKQAVIDQALDTGDYRGLAAEDARSQAGLTDALFGR